MFKFKHILWIAIVLMGFNVQAVPITMLQKSADSLQARVDLINRAKKSITAQYFTIDHDRISLGSLALLRNAAARGVKVRILVDSMNNKMTREMMSALLMNNKFQQFGNIEIREYNSLSLFHPSRIYKRMHDKSLIIDDEILIAGGRNIANGYFDIPDGNQDPTIFQDSDMIIFGGQAASEAQKYFDSLWLSKNVNVPMLYEYDRKNLEYDACMGVDDWFSCQNRREMSLKKVDTSEQVFESIVEKIKTGKSDLVVYDSGKDWSDRSFDAKDIEFLSDPVRGRDADKKGEGIAKRLYGQIDKLAKRNVLIVTPYFILTPEQEKLFDSLIGRGVAVTVITNSRQSNDVPAAQAGYEVTRNRTVNMGVRIFEYQGPETLHAKMVLIDQSHLFIGSYNWDYRSENLNREVGVLTQIPDSGLEMFNMDLSEKMSTILSKSQVYDPKDNGLIELSLRDFFKVDMKSKSIMIWKILFPVVHGQL